MSTTQTLLTMLVFGSVMIPIILYLYFKNKSKQTLSEPSIRNKYDVEAELRSRIIKLEQDLESLQVSQGKFRLELQALLDEATLQYKRASGKMAQIEKKEQQELDRENVANVQNELFQSNFVIPNSNYAKSNPINNIRIAK